MASGSRIVYKGGPNAGDPVRQFALFYDKVAERHEQLVEDAAVEGAEVMRELIETRGTGNQWSQDYGGMAHGHAGRTASVPGRVASGHMRDSVRHSATTSRKGNKVARFGWFEGEAEDYFKYQEGGFDHKQAGVTVEGMYALQDARDRVLSDLRARLADGA